MKKNNWIVPSLIVVGIFLIIFSILSPQNNTRLQFSKKKIAYIVEKNGSVKIKNNEISTNTEVNIKDKVELRDILRTDANSEAVVEFNNSSQFRITEKSEVLIDLLDNGTPLVVIRTGEVFIEAFGNSTSFWVRKDGRMYNATDYALIDKKRAPKIKTVSSDQQNKEQISQIEIENILNSKKTDFFKCYGRLIQKDPQATGQVLIAFTIEQQGHTSKIEISKSEFTDADFKSCLKEVVARTQFRPTSGNPIATVFPMKFE